MSAMDSRIKSVYDSVIARDPNQPEFHQAVEEVLESLSPVIDGVSRVYASNRGDGGG